MKIFVDIDGTICTTVTDGQYQYAAPIQVNIDIINDLYRRGHEIIYWTARGTETGIDWRKVTLKQFKEWGVKYNGLELGKPTYDLFIDDKAINADSINKLKEE
jgi:dTDP-glucose 4,6-dehydratase